MAMGWRISTITSRLHLRPYSTLPACRYNLLPRLSSCSRNKANSRWTTMSASTFPNSLISVHSLPSATSSITPAAFAISGISSNSPDGVTPDLITDDDVMSVLTTLDYAFGLKVGWKRLCILDFRFASGGESHPHRERRRADPLG